MNSSQNSALKTCLDCYVAPTVDFILNFEIQKFLSTFERFGKARITLKAGIYEDDELYASFEGDYVVVKSPE